MTAHFTLLRPQALDDSGDPISGAKLYFFDAGSTNPRTVYEDKDLTTAHGTFVVAESDGAFPPIYPPYGDYDVLMTNGSDAGNDFTRETTIRAKITTQGPVDLTSFQTTTAKSVTPAITKATDYTVVEADRGKAIDVNPNNTTVTITLESAAVAGDGSEITVKHTGGSNAVILSTVGGELIDDHSEIVLVRPGSSVTLRSDGANWKIKSISIPDSAILHAVTNRTLVSPPTSPDIGSKYIMSDGTLTGQWSGYSAGDLIIYVGSGGYQLIDKMAGDRAYIIDENMDSRWTGSAWEDLSNITAPPSSVIETARYEILRNAGNTGGTVVTNKWTSRGGMNLKSNNVTGLTVDSNGIMTFAAGTYYISATQVQYSANDVRTRFVCLNKPSIKIESEDIKFAVGFSMQISLSGPLEVTEEMVAAGENTFDHQYFRSNSVGRGLGDPTSFDAFEHYGNVQVINLTSLQGPQGNKGIQGDRGDDGDNGADGFGEIYVQDAEPVGALADNALWIRSTDFQVFISSGGSFVDQNKNIKGDQGEKGANWLDGWSSATNYAPDDAVSYDGSSYICLANHTNQQPPNATYWGVLAERGAAGAGSGDVIGPASATDNAIAIYNGASGKTIKGSSVTIDASGNLDNVGTYNGVDISSLALASSIRTDEEIQDVVGAMCTSNTETLISVSYDDNDGTLDFAVDNDLSNYDNSTSAFLTQASGSDISITSQAQGDLAYFDGSSWVRLPAGTSGQFLKTQGPSSNPAWETIGGGGDMLASNNLSDVANIEIARSNISASSSGDVLALSLRVADLEGDALGLEDGIADPFDDETDVDAVASTGATYNSSNDLYTSGGGDVSGGHSDGSQGGSGTTYLDRTWTLINDNTVLALGVYSTDAQSVTAKIALRNSAGNYDIVASEAFSHTGSGWEYVNLSTPYVVPSSGNYYLCSHSASSINRSSQSVVRATFSGEAIGTGVSMSESTGNTSRVGVRYATTNILLQSKVFTADAAPNRARMLFQIKPIDSITINTDAIGSVSRDGGTTFTSATLVEKITYADGTKLFEADVVDLSGQPLGTSMKWKLETANNKAVEISGAVLQWS